MRNIWTIARKELRGYFDHPTAYILAVVFLVVNFFFFFRSVYLVGHASLRSMFDLLPWFLLFFVPAATMSSLAEERRHGTLEVLSSQPLQMYEILLGKYLGNLLFLLIVLTTTLLAPLTLTLGGKFDLGVVFAQYVGSALLLAAVTAVGVCASSLTRNQITAFIVGTAVTFFLILVGAEVLQIGLPAWLSSAIGQLGILPHFYNVTRGVLDLRDMIYFVTLAVAFLSLAYWMLMRERLNRKAKLYRNLRLGTAAIVGIAIAANMFGRYMPGRVDLTAEGLYTVSEGTREVLGDLDDVVTITLFVSKELPTQVKIVQRDVEDVLRDFERYGQGNVQLIRKHPDRSEEARDEAQRLGIQSVQFNVLRREELQVKQGWLGIAVQYTDQSEVIPFAGDSRNLEYQLATNVWKLTSTETPKVAFITGHGERTQADYGAFNRELQRTYQVSTVDLSNDSVTIEPDVDAVIVAGPRRAIGPRARRILRQYLNDDGRVLYLGSGVDVNLQYLFASAAPDSAVDFVEGYGVRLNKDMVFDLRSNETISVPGQVFNYVVQYPFWVRALPAAEHAITRGLNSVFLPWPGSLDTLSSPGRETIPLLTTSRFAGAQRGNFQIRPDQNVIYDEADLKTYVLAVALAPVSSGDAGQAAAPGGSIKLGVGQSGSGDDEGDDDDAGAGEGAGAGDDDDEGDDDQEGDRTGDAGAAEQDTAAPVLMRPVEKFVTAGTQRGRLVIVSDADFLSDQFVRNSVENIIFGLNAVGWLTQSNALLSIRSKAPTPRPLVFASDSTRTLIKYFNLIGVPLAFVLVGVFRTLRRRRLKGLSYAA